MKTTHKHYVVAIAVIIAFCSCNKVKDKAAEKITEFIVDNELYYFSEQYKYEYDGERLMSETNIHYQIMLGQVVDSSMFVQSYIYDDKGLLRETRSYRENELYGVREFIYDSNDSLIREYNGSGSHYIEYGYFPDGRQVISNMYVLASVPDDLDFNTDDDLLKMVDAIQTKTDTVFSRYEYLYEDTICVERKKYDKDYNPVGLEEYTYNDGVITEVKHYSFLDSSKVLDKTAVYEYSKSKLYPDELHTDKTGHIIEYIVHKFNEAGELVAYKHSSEYGDYVETMYFENDREIGSVSASKRHNYEITKSISYYENGDIKEVRTSTKDYIE